MASGKSKSDMPGSRKLMWYTIEALRKLGGAGCVTDVNELVGKLAGLTPEQRARSRPSSNRNDFDYRCAWARTHLKGRSVVEKINSRRWKLKDIGWSVTEAELKSN